MASIINHPSALNGHGWLFARRWAEANAASPRFVENAALYWWFWTMANLRPEVGYAQYAAETGWGKYGRAVTEDMCNPAGIKVANPGADDAAESHERFRDWPTGICAHANHMLAYVGRPPAFFPTHERLEIARRFVQVKVGWINDVEQLGGLWAPNPEYGKRVAALVDDLMMEPWRGPLL